MNAAKLEARKQRKRCRAENRIVRWNAGNFGFRDAHSAGRNGMATVRLMVASRRSPCTAQMAMERTIRSALLMWSKFTNKRLHT